MSYDISIQSGTSGSSVSKVELRNVLLELGLIADSETHFLFQESGKNCADMDLAWCEGDGSDEPGDAVNCMQVHIPYGNVESMLEGIVKQCRGITEKLGWSIYDEQEGKYLP
jgi:hypothetical protein